MRQHVLAPALLAITLLPGSPLAQTTAGTQVPGAVTRGSPHPARRSGGCPFAARAATPSSTGPCHVPREGTLLVAGDIPTCPHRKPAGTARATAAIIGANHGTAAPLGDLVNGYGSRGDSRHCYGPTWGRYKSRTRPAPGNHDYKHGNAAAYFSYFGARAGPRGKGYYSYNLATWHIVVLNSNCSYIGGCGAGSPEEMWLRSDLARHRALCTLAYWHKPLFTSGTSGGGDPALRTFWQDLYSFGAEVVLNGHWHQYERFAPQTPSGALDPFRGIREFVVGTGGSPLNHFRTIKPNSQVRNDTTYGVLKLTLQAGSYHWRFLPARGHTFTDSGRGTCHRAGGQPALPVWSPAPGA